MTQQNDRQEIDVRIVQLEPMRVASFHGFGTEPETKAFDKLYAWMEAQDRMATFQEHRIFGFNNPEPSAGSPNYGYEVWVEVEPEVEATEGMQIKTFDGGLYAVLTCTPRSGEEIGENWQRLVAWLARSSYQHARHQWLEGHHWAGSPRKEGDPFEVGELTLKLYMPVQA